MFKEERKTLESEYKDHFHTWKAHPTPFHTGRLLAAVKPVLDTAVKSYGGHAAGSPTLHSTARRMAVNAFHSYDPDRGSLKTHLLSQLRSLQRAGAQESQVIHLPEQVSLDFHHIRNSESELRDKHGREPSDAEISNHSGLSLKRIKHIRQSQLPVSEGATTAGMDDNEQSPMSLVPGQTDDEGWLSLVHDDLSPHDQVIMEHLLGMHGRPRSSVTAVAKKLHLSPGAISQRASRIQALIDERHELGIL